MSSGTEKLASGIVESLERIDKEREDISAQEIKLDGSNKVSFPGYPYIFEALHEKILVSIDIFKSGYECKVCKGKKRIKVECECAISGHAGKKYSFDAIDSIRREMGDIVANARLEMACPECLGNYKSKERDEECSECHGRGALIVLPETSKSLPTTGMVVSMGKVARNNAEYKVGDRVLFGPYAGSMIPTKTGLMFKSIDWNQIWCKIEGADDLGAFDFIIQEDN
jgi:co-chaperonin GroES (HSP10)